MNILDKIPFDKNILYDDTFHFNGQQQFIYLQKGFLTPQKKTQYFLKVFIKQPDLICQGYIYFYLDYAKHSSDFIGIYVKEEFRNNGIASLLVSLWIDFCLNNHFDFLGTNKKTKKTFFNLFTKNLWI